MTPLVGQSTHELGGPKVLREGELDVFARNNTPHVGLPVEMLYFHGRQSVVIFGPFSQPPCMSALSSTARKPTRMKA